MPVVQNRSLLLVLSVVVGVGLVIFRPWDKSSAESEEEKSTNKETVTLAEKGQCANRINRETLDESLRLGTEFLLQHQKEEGNFDYEYNWVEKTYTPGDSQVRQAGAAWGLALIYQDSPNEKIGQAIERALGFFEKHSRRSEDGRRYIVYPGEQKGSLGTVALVALTLIDYLRGAEDSLDAEKLSHYQNHLKEYIAFLRSAVRDDKRFHKLYSIEDGSPSGPSSPYFDGESLLALVKAARYMGYDELKPFIFEAADAGYKMNNKRARKKDPDSKITKGYFQWSSMAYYELTTSGWPDCEKYGKWLIDLAVWMIDTHETLTRTRNTGYAYEGIIPAYEVARLRKENAYVNKFGCVIEKSLEKLTTWQVGHSMANSSIQEKGPPDSKAIGGVQNHRSEPQLRIDVAQHQMHAVILARRFYFTKSE